MTEGPGNIPAGTPPPLPKYGGRMPERDKRAADSKRRLSNEQIGVIAIVLLILFTYLAFSKDNPLTGDGYTLNATFRNSVNVRVDSPVRIAGVNVGKVIGARRDGNYTTVSFTVSDEGRPVRENATVALRPRILFEGNYFLDLTPGEPSASELESGDTIPVSDTSTAVQFDEVLTALKDPQREDLGKLLIEYGKSLTHKPTAKENVDQDPEVQGKTGGQALNKAFAYGGAAGRESARVTEAFLGTEPRDLSRLIGSSGDWFGAFVSREGELQELITNFNTTMGAFASESENLSDAAAELGPTVETAHRSFVNLNESLPPLRRFSIELEPAVAELPATIATADPWLAAAKPLLAGPAVGGVSRSLERATPALAGAQAFGYGALHQIDLLSRCTSAVLVPTGRQVLNDQFSTGQPNYREFFYATVGISGESQGFDGNGPFLRLQAGGGGTLAQTTDPNPIPNQANNQFLFANTFEPPIGTQPIHGPQPPKKPKVKCMTQPVPDLNGPSGQVGSPSPHAP